MWVRGTNPQTTLVQLMNQRACRSRDGVGRAALLRGLRPPIRGSSLFCRQLKPSTAVSFVAPCILLKIAKNTQPFEKSAVRIELGHISAIFRYPIKSMAGTRLDSAKIGWHGIEGDRRLAFRRLAERGAFPWLTASRLPELLLYQPIGRQETPGEPLPTHVRTPDGKEYSLTDEALVKEIATRHRADLELIQLKHGIFDEAVISAITLGTIQSIGREAGHDLDIRRFRPNLVIDSQSAQPFEEDQWVGKVLEFGSDGTGPAISVTMRDPRCVMLNLDPDTAAANADIMQAVIRMNENHAGVYGTVIRTGELRVGQVLGLRS
jgi:uncharacterized protein YcbX